MSPERSYVSQPQEPAWRQLLLHAEVPVINHWNHVLRVGIERVRRDRRGKCDIRRSRRRSGKGIRGSQIRIAEGPFRLRHVERDAERGGGITSLAGNTGIAR